MRFRIVKLIFSVAFLLVLSRLFFWQILNSEMLTAKAESQRTSSKTILAPRGSIQFMDGSVLASSQPIFLIYAQPKIIKEKVDQVSSALAEIFVELDLSPGQSPTPQELEQLRKETGEMLKKRINQDLNWVSLGKKVDIHIKQKIEKLNLPGIGFEEHIGRYYPESSSSAHLLGFVGVDDYGQETGYFGLEGFYNRELVGRSGLLVQDRDALGFPILIGQYINKEAKSGKTLVLTIDRTVQHIVEEKLKKGIIKYGAKGASAAVMDPQTGNILAMASYPNYFPGKPTDYLKEYFKNPIVADGYEPGSTFKVLVMAAGINEGVIKPETVCDFCDGPLEIGGFTIRTWNNKYQNNLTMTQAIINS